MLANFGGARLCQSVSFSNGHMHAKITCVCLFRMHKSIRSVLSRTAPTTVYSLRIDYVMTTPLVVQMALRQGTRNHH